jgi:hypothetical protein
MRLEVLDRLDGDQVEAAWRLYLDAFSDLAAHAVQRHLMSRSEFEEMAADTRVLKYLAYDEDGSLGGLSTYSNQLETMPLISPQYFERRWPEHFAEGRVWYCGFVAVHPAGNGAFPVVVEAMYRHVEKEGGVIALDVCQYNDDRFRLPKAINLMLSRISNGVVRPELADSQQYWIYQTAPAS